MVIGGYIGEFAKLLSPYIPPSRLVQDGGRFVDMRASNDASRVYSSVRGNDSSEPHINFVGVGSGGSANGLSIR